MRQIIHAEGYSVNDVLTILKAEDELDPDVVLALSVAKDYMILHSGDTELINTLGEAYEARLNELKEYYSRA